MQNTKCRMQNADEKYDLSYFTDHLRSQSRISFETFNPRSVKTSFAFPFMEMSLYALSNSRKR